MGDLGALCSATEKMQNGSVRFLVSGPLSGRDILVSLMRIEGCAVEVREVGSIGVENGGHVVKGRISAIFSCGSGFGCETLTGKLV